jgi:hypothetical protein
VNLPSESRTFSRRRFLLAGGVVAGLIILPWKALAAKPARWSDPRVWGNAVPGPGDIARVSRAILLDASADVKGLVVEAGGELIFASDRHITLRSRSNVIVRGRLTMRPARPSITHRLTFVDVDEAGFVGGGMKPIATDTGLWVMGNGVLELKGSPKLAWTRADEDVPAGVNRVRLRRDPNGWRVGDVVAITPTASPVTFGHHTMFDTATIRAIHGKTITLSERTTFSHPEVLGLGAEILNLSRNVRVEGQSTGRAHIFIRSSRPSIIRNTLVRHMGPRRAGSKVAGRWPIHFHHAGDGSRGSTVDGTVVRDAGSHAFVPHASNGVTFRDCIAYEVQEVAYWWDHEDTEGTDGSDDILWKDCVAALVRAGEGENALNGFQLEYGKRNEVRGCVAVGVQGAATAAGFHWPSRRRIGVWKFENCVAHNNAVNGIYAWQNDGKGKHNISHFKAYRNGKAGIEHGAYGNVYNYTGVTLYQNGDFGIANHARTGSSRRLAFKNVSIKGGGVTRDGVLLFDNVGAPIAPVKFIDVEILATVTPIRVRTSFDPILVDFVRPTVGSDKRNLLPSDVVVESMAAGSLIRVQRKNDRSAWQLDDTGLVIEIPPFA